MVIAAPLDQDPAAADSALSPTVERGRYPVRIAGCNDCHTPGYLLSGWLTGGPFGWRAPWATAYTVNIRLRLQDFTEEQ